MSEDQIKIGDMVRWSWPWFGRYADGELISDKMVELSDGKSKERRIQIRVTGFAGFDDDCSSEDDPPLSVGSVQEFGFAYGGVTLTRI